MQAVANGGDVYLFLAEMMLLFEAARREGLFDWTAGDGGRTREALAQAAIAFGLVVVPEDERHSTAVHEPNAVGCAWRSRT